MKKTLLVLLLCVLVGFAFVSCKSTPKIDPNAPEVKYDGMIYNQTSEAAYEDLPSAVAAIQEGDTLIFFKDEVLFESVTFSQSITLDLNGHIIDGTGIDLSNAGKGKTNTASNHGVIEFTGVIGDHIKSAVVMNGTIKGSVCGANSCGTIRGIYVEDLQLSNVNLINEVPLTGEIYLGLDEEFRATMRSISSSIYNAYCNLTINNTDENEIVGRIITYMNDAQLEKEGYIVSVTTINGGKIMNDTTSDDTNAITLSNAKGNVSVVFNNGEMTSGIVNNMAGTQVGDTNLTVNGGTFCIDVKKYLGEGHTGAAADGKYVVK